jgi:hypothetical protein
MDIIHRPLNAAIVRQMPSQCKRAEFSHHLTIDTQTIGEHSGVWPDKKANVNKVGFSNRRGHMDFLIIKTRY